MHCPKNTKVSDAKFIKIFHAKNATAKTAARHDITACGFAICCRAPFEADDVPDFDGVEPEPVLVPEDELPDPGDDPELAGDDAELVATSTLDSSTPFTNSTELVSLSALR